MKKMCRVQTRDGEQTWPEGTSLLEIANALHQEDEEPYLLAVQDNRLRELHHSIHGDCTLSFLTASDKNGRKAYRRSLILLMQCAADMLEPQRDVDIRVMFTVSQSYFCRLYARPKGGKEPFTAQDGLSETWLAALEAEMRRLVEADLPIRKSTQSTQAVRQSFGQAGLTDKERLLRYRISSYTNLYELKGCRDYFYGYMAPSTGCLRIFSLVPWEDGFLLRYPDADGRTLPPFHPSVKLFQVLDTSGSWSRQLSIPSVGALDEAISAGLTRQIILTQEALMEQQIGMIADRIASQGRRCVMVAGPSSSGKTTFSHRLSIQLQARGLLPSPVPLDSYYRGRDLIPVDEHGERDYEALSALDVPLFNENMTDLLEGRQTEIPVYSFITGKREPQGRPMKLAEKGVLVIEGIHGLNDELSYAIPAQSKYKIYISALSQLAIDEHNPMSTTDGRLLRRIVRDARTRGTKAEDTIAMWDSVRRGEEKYIFPFQDSADEMFNSALIYEMCVLKLYAEPLLFGIEASHPVYGEAVRLLKLMDYFLPMPTEDIANNSLIREFIGGGCFGL